LGLQGRDVQVLHWGDVRLRDHLSIMPYLIAESELLHCVLLGLSLPLALGLVIEAVELGDVFPTL